MKERGDLKKEVEAVLFAASRKVSLDEIAKLCKAEKKETEGAIKELKQDYEQKNSPLLLTQEADGYKLTVREKYLSIVKEITPHTELNRAMMETLAVIAWKQPVLQSEVIKIRTSNAYDDIRNLVEMGFISKEKHGRTFILKPTGKFFEYFDLPSKEAVKEVFKDVKDVEPEIQEKLEAAKEAGDHLGKLDVYESSEKKEKPGEEEPKAKLGGLEVFAEPEKEEKGEDEEAENESAPGEEIAEESEKEITDEEKARDMIHKLAGEDEETEESSEESDEEPEKEAEEPVETEEKKESKTKESKEEKKKRLPKELEEFAGINEKEKKKEE